MTAQELFVTLSEMTADQRAGTYIVLAADAEGNGFSPLHEAVEESGRDIELTRVVGSVRDKIASGRVLVLWPM